MTISGKLCGFTKHCKAQTDASLEKAKSFNVWKGVAGDTVHTYIYIQSDDGEKSRIEV